MITLATPTSAPLMVDEGLRYEATITGKEILTPPAAAEPRLNGAAIFGVRPGKPVHYRIAASGAKLLRYEAEGLPAGVTVDPGTGWLTGRAPREPGDYVITLKVSNHLGESTRVLTLRVGDRFCLTPPMGWNSWYVHSEGISDAAVREMALAMREKGLDSYGWTYINIDDCWMGLRDPETKAIQPNEKFGDMKELSAFVNATGFKLGIYSTPWMSTFAGFIGGTGPTPEGDYSEFFQPEGERLNPGQFFGRHPSSTRLGLARVGPWWFVDRDAKQFAEWGIDYVKYDWVEGEMVQQEDGFFERVKGSLVEKTYAVTERFYQDFRSLDRDIVISLSPGHTPETDALAVQFCNLWRLTADIEARWSDLQRPFSDELVHRYPLTRPGLYGDLDMLQIGPLGKPNRAEKVFAPSPLTGPEQYFQFTLWCILSQPLLLSCNIPQMDAFDLNLVTNQEVLAVNQDPLVKQGCRVCNEPGIYEIWAKDLVDGAKALAFFNLSDEDRDLAITAEKLGRTGLVRDLWRQQDVGSLETKLTVRVSAHGAALFTVQ
jgi:alpha-galactosidase